MATKPKEVARRSKNLLAFNRGVISDIGLARIDLERMLMSASEQRNFMPRVLGSMMLRPGLEFIDNTNLNDFARNIPFIFQQDDKALIEMTEGDMRVRINGELLSRFDVATTIANSLFETPGHAAWADTSDAAGVASITGSGHVLLKGNETDFGRVEQTVTVDPADQGVEHGLRIVVTEGPVLLKVGTTSGDDDLLEGVRLTRGRHSLAFTPSVGTIYISLANELLYNAWVNECAIEQGGIPLVIPTPYSEADLPFLRWDQSGDVIYLACKNGDSDSAINAQRLMKIERRGTGRSWSLVDYFPEDGPFRIQNTTGLTLTPSGLVGDITITASEPLFKQEHATHRSLWRIASQGQVVTQSISAEDTWTSPIRVTGNDAAREFGILITGTFTATVSLQFAFDEAGPWNDQGQTWTSPVSTNYDDGQDGQIIYYRIGVKTGDFTSGPLEVQLTYTGGSIQGIARTRFFTSETVIQAQVLQDFGATGPSSDWWEGEWSQRRGYPTAVAIHEGRLFWGGNDKIWGSVPDGYESFDDENTFDDGPISRQIGSGPIRVINWLVSMGRLMMGTTDNSANIGIAKMDGNHPLGARSNSFDEPMTPTNFNIKTISSRSVFVDRTEQRLYELVYDIDQQDYKSLDLSVFAPSFNEIGIRQIAVQMKPDIRVHCVRNDGTVGVLVYDRLENVICWCDVASDAAGGEIEDVAVLPGRQEDEVYYTVKRTIDGFITQRHVCKWALESEARGGTVNKMADSFVHYSGVATDMPFTTELAHLRGETVTIWADGRYVGTDLVTPAGALQNRLEVPAAEVVAGLEYQGRYRSVKLAELEGFGLLERKRVTRVGFVAKWLHHLGLRYGPSFDKLVGLPQVENGKNVAPDTIWEDYHEDDIAFGGDWDADSRICLQATAPLPVTLLAAIAVVESIEKGP